MTTNPQRPKYPHNRLLGTYGTALFLMVLAISALVRWRGSFNNLWLDEIWSIAKASEVTSPLEVFTKLHHEINHYLNTLYLYFTGFRGDWSGYRLPSLIAGIATVALAWLIGLRRSRETAFFALITIAFSYLLILYSSEARGYSTAIFFAFFCYYLLDRHLEKPGLSSTLLFAVSSVLGLASHLTFASFLCAAFAWSGYRLWHTRNRFSRVLSNMAILYAAPLLFSVWLYLVDLRELGPGGGDDSSLLLGFRNALAWTIGTTHETGITVIACLAALLIFGGSMVMLWRERSDTIIFFSGVILLFPVLLVAARESNAIYVRHFVIGIAFLQLLFGFLVAELFRRQGSARVASLLLLAVYLIVNGWNTSKLFNYGRGEYREAIIYMAGITAGPSITVGSDHDFRIPTVLHFHERGLPRGKRVRYYDESSWPQSGPEWIICHKESYEDPKPPEQELIDKKGNRYDLTRTYLTAPLSGLHWYIYHNRGFLNRKPS
jgi:hypothetical protein